MLCCAGEVGGPAHGRQRGKPQAGPGPCQEEARRSKGTLKFFVRIFIISSFQSKSSPSMICHQER